MRSSPPKNTTQKKKKKKTVVKQTDEQQTPKATNEEQKSDEKSAEKQTLIAEQIKKEAEERSKKEAEERSKKEAEEQQRAAKEQKKTAKIQVDMDKKMHIKLMTLLEPITDYRKWNFLKVTGKLNDIFFIPEDKSFQTQQKEFFVSTSVAESKIINDFLRILLSVYGKLSELFHRHKFPYQIVFKGTRALELATKTRIETRDIDISFIRLTEEPDKRQILATNVANIMQYICGKSISILNQPNRGHKPPLLKLSVIIRKNVFIPLSDIGYADEDIIKKKYVSIEDGGFYFVAPDLSSLLEEKLGFYDRYTTNNDEQGKVDIKKGLCKFVPFLKKYSSANAIRVREICGVEEDSPDSEYGTPDSIPS